MLLKLNSSFTSWPLFLVILSSLLLFSCMPVPGDEEEDDITTGNDCTTVPDLFTKTVWPSVREICVDCHNSGGVANNTRLVFKQRC